MDIMQALTSLNFIMGKESGEDDRKFDRITIELKDGQKRDIYFDISEFFGGVTELFGGEDKSVERALQKLYG